MDVCNVIQAPVVVARCSQRAPWTGAPSMVSTRVSSSHRTLCFRTSIHLYRRQAKWYAARNSTWPLRAATRWPMMTQDAVQFSGAFFVGSVRDSNACFTGRQVTPLPSYPSTRPWKRAGKKVSHSTSSTMTKASPIPGVTLCTNYHSCWSYFCSLA